jgi:hypothetical protein
MKYRVTRPFGAHQPGDEIDDTTHNTNYLLANGLIEPITSTTNTVKPARTNTRKRKD